MMRQLGSVAALAAATVIGGAAAAGNPVRSVDRGLTRTTVVKPLSDTAGHKTLARGGHAGWGHASVGHAGWGHAGWGHAGWGHAGWGGWHNHGWGWGGWHNHGWGWGIGVGFYGGWGWGGYYGWPSAYYQYYPDYGPIYYAPPVATVYTVPTITYSVTPAYFTSPAISGGYSSPVVVGGARTIPPALPVPDKRAVPTIPVDPTVSKVGPGPEETMVSLPPPWKQFAYSPTGGIPGDPKPAARPGRELLVTDR